MSTETRSDLPACGLLQTSRASRLILLASILALLGACRQDMHDQAKIEPLEGSAFFDDGAGSRQPPPNTVARGQLREDRPFYTGFIAERRWVEELPVELDAELLERGRERFTIYCTPCHDRTGSGRGIVVQRGFKQPPSYHQDRLRQMPIGYFFDVITNGFGVMSSYAAQVKPEDRWAIAAYVRVLQRSQYAPTETLTPSDIESLEEQAGLPTSAEPGEPSGPAAGGAR